MARLISLQFLPNNTKLLLSDASGGALSLSIPLTAPYPFIFPNLSRTITFTSPDDLSGTNFTISGADQYGNLINEILEGPNGNTVTSALQYNKVNNVSSSGAYTNLSIGSGNSATFQWIKLDTFSTVGLITIAAEIVSKAEEPLFYSIFTTLDKLEYYKTVGATYQYVRPFRAVLLGNDPLTTVDGSRIVTVTVPSTAGIVSGDIVLIEGAEDTGGLPASIINGRSMVNVIDETHFTYQIAEAANSDDVGGGSAVTYSLPAPPFVFPLKDEDGNPIDDVTESTISQHEGIPAVQVVVNSAIEGTGMVINILQQGID